MKGKVFIGWSGTLDIALRVKAALERGGNGYVCYTGGNDDNSSVNLSIGDTVLKQMNDCNQAIMIFQNKPSTNEVSANLLFELGYLMSELGVQKVHCVRRAADTIVLPSDFDNALVAPIDCSDEQGFADGIVAYFQKRQKLAIDKNKMMLIDKRHVIRDYIDNHYICSKCSDYELAQYVLFYMQAAQMFRDEKKTAATLSAFKTQHGEAFSPELGLAVDIALAFLRFSGSLHISPSAEIYTDLMSFVKFSDDCERFLRILGKRDDPEDDFGAWARLFIEDLSAYSNMLFATNAENPDEIRREYYTNTIEHADCALEWMTKLRHGTDNYSIFDKSNEELFCLLSAYMYRNKYIASVYLHDERALEWLELSLNERASLKDRYEEGAIDSRLHDNFLMEYYLVLAERLTYPISPLRRQVYVDEIQQYLAKAETDDAADRNIYLERISYFVKSKPSA